MSGVGFKKPTQLGRSQINDARGFKETAQVSFEKLTSQQT